MLSESPLVITSPSITPRPDEKAIVEAVKGLTIIQVARAANVLAKMTGRRDWRTAMGLGLDASQDGLAARVKARAVTDAGELHWKARRFIEGVPGTHSPVFWAGLVIQGVLLEMIVPVEIR